MFPHLSRCHLPVILAVATTVVGVAERADAGSSPSFAAWDFSPGNLGQGTLDGVDFSVSVTGGGPRHLSTANLNNATWDFAGSQSYLDYNGMTVTITFAEAVTDLSLYLYYFRGSVGANGADLYTFSEDFTVNANFDGNGGVESSTLRTPNYWASGVLSFSGPITSLSWTPTNEDTESAVFVDAQGFTFSGTAAGSSSPVPGPGGLMAVVGLARIARRRRR